VRQLALSVLNAAARTKPHLLRDHLHTLLPVLYRETIIKPELVRIVQMGPWQHKVDDGLEARKTAYETLYTLVCVFLLFGRDDMCVLIPAIARHVPDETRPE
jgi:cullin-associated NEDD8-dissociated protein 1